MFIYEIYYINIYKPPLNVDDKAKDDFTFGSLPEVEWLEWDYEDLLQKWSNQMDDWAYFGWNCRRFNYHWHT